MWIATADQLLKIERGARDKFLTDPELNHADMAEAHAAEQSIELGAFMDASRKKHEFIIGYLDKLEARLKNLQTAGSGSGGDNSSKPHNSDSTKGSFQGHVAPGRLAPLNHSNGSGDGYTIASRPHQPFTQTYAPASANKGSTALRSSEHYLSPVGALPLAQGVPHGAWSPRGSDHRTPPRLGHLSAHTYPNTISGVGVDPRALHDAARRVFIAYDRDRSGDIDAAELRAALRDLGLDATSGQAAAIVAKYDNNRDARLDFVEFSQLLHELRQFQAQQLGAPQRLVASVPLEPARSRITVPLGGGGMRTSGGGFYSSEELRAIQEAAARQAVLAEHARVSDPAQLASLDAGPPP